MSPGGGHHEETAAELPALLLFLLFVVQAWAGGGREEVLGAVQGAALLSPSRQNLSALHRVHWRRGRELKVAVRDRGSEVQYPSKDYRGRLELLPNNSLRISPLRKNDSSTYQVYLEQEQGEVHVESIPLRVYDRVPKPSLRVRVSKAEPELCSATLECEVEPEEELGGVTYEWLSPRRPLLAGAKLQVAFNPSLETYTCRASNPVSSSNASLTFRPPCSWADLGMKSAALVL
ncbi:CD48 antigen [Dryobates pubescens]|uniref:CD48 antigen n=1 Tax=Dryobates pubescens TaxID=118200 RepID=UPI0023B8C39F|nr:CD48 antigen [Dryobates pubescens]